MNKVFLIIAALAFCLSSCNSSKKNNENVIETPMIWDNANIYFLLTDRFKNADPNNDVNFGRDQEAAINRGFQGGDLKGVTAKIKDGYFDKLGISAIWMTPFFEQTHGMVDEGTGKTYGYHGYWAVDFTALDPNYGSEEELIELIETARAHHIRIVMDVVINHTGPVTDKDPVWDETWVRTAPQCTYQGYESTIPCTLVKNLPDIRTDNEDNVELPQALLDKWEKEGRLEKELEELEVFFATTGYPRAPKYYIIKWLTDYIRKYGISAYRLDTAKHTEEGVWSVLRKEADRAYAEWKELNPGVVPEDDEFYMVGEVYNYGISGGRWFNFGDTLVDYYAEGMDHLINFEFKHDAHKGYEELFSKYSSKLQNELKGKGVLNYISSHDDGGPFDGMREKPLEAATKLLLCPGAVQLYYGDESSRVLYAEGANGDANLRSFMNWEEIAENAEVNGFMIQDVLHHYQKLGIFRKNHPAVGAGEHKMISEKPYYFSRTYNNGVFSDKVIAGLDLPLGKKEIMVADIFDDNCELYDYYSGVSLRVKNGLVTINNEENIVLLGLKK